MAIMDINATLDVVSLLNNARMALYREGQPNAVTAILLRAAQRLDNEARRALTGESA